VTNIVEFGARTSIERQAREWLIRMDKDEPLSDAELAGLREWMARSPMHRQELRRLAKFWEQANVLTELAVALEPVGRRRSGIRAILAASVIVASGLMAWQVYLHRFAGVTNGIYTTAVGLQRTVLLADGSSIQMNTDSQVQVFYTTDARRVRLLHGEALFSVKPKPQRPFEVYAGDKMVRAVGTAFAVHFERRKVDVTVTKGVVDIAQIETLPHELTPAQKMPAPPAPLHRLKAGQATTLEGGAGPVAVRQIPESELQRRMAWREGYLVFSGEPLSEVIEELNRYSQVTVRIGDPSLAAVAIGGRFKIGDLDAVLEVLSSNFGIQYERGIEGSILLEPSHSQ
jgi:transmembrane sensor